MKVLVKRLVVVVLFLIIALYVFNRAPEYDLEYKYKDGDIRVIFNDVEITRDTKKLPQTAMLVDGEIMLSQDTIDILFDKNLYYEEKYDTFITTSEEHRADLKVDSKVVTIDDKDKNLIVPPIEVNYQYRNDNRYEGEEATKSKKIVYFPIQALEEVYDIEIEFKEKIIITENDRNRIRIIVKEEDSFELKHAKDKFAKNVEVIEAGKYIDIYDYDSTKEFVLARSEAGELGYILNEKLQNYDLTPVTTAKEEIEPQKVNVAWDYINPDATQIGNKATRKKIEPIDVVAPTLLYLKNTEGDIKYNTNVVKSYLAWAEDAGYRVWPTLKNEYSTRHFSLDETSEFLNDMNHRAKAIDSLIEFANTYKIDGINIDLEYIYQKDATAFSQFIRELCVKAKQQGIVISVCVNVPDGSPNWSLCYQHKTLSERADYLAVMTYDQYGANADAAGPNASLDWVTANIEKIVERDGVNSNKVLLGIALYSRLWTSNTGSLESKTLYMNAAKEYLNKADEAIWIEEAGQYFYENKAGTTQLWIEENESIAQKLKLVSQYDLGGTAYWMLGYETEDIWKTVSENLK